MNTIIILKLWKWQTVMVNNSPNINKANNHLSTQFIEHNKKITIYDNANLDPGLGPEQICGLVNI